VSEHHVPTHRALLLLTLPLVACEADVVLRQEVVVDEYVQADVPGADVVVVVDDSKSMVEEQALLKRGFGAFLEVLLDTDADYRLGVTSTSADGVLRGGVLSPYTGDLYNTALAALNVGTDGDREERGLDAARAALDPTTHPDFRRAEARLQLVFFSDEDDHSADPVADHLTALRAIAGAQPMTVHAVVGDLPSGCASPDGAADPGLRYLDAVAATTGLRESICAESYDELLQRVGFEVSGRADTFALSTLPQPDTLEVLVDGVRMHGRDIDGWTYEPARNAVIFHGTAVPRAGMEITIRYNRLPTGASAPEVMPPEDSPDSDV
jgi:hypothetical protein